jgi:hypothetical protein
MTIDWGRVAPVLVSIAIIISVAVLRQYSKTVAAVAATMPINMPLGLWIVYSGAPNDRAAIIQFSEVLMISLPATFAFATVAWITSRAGWGLAPMIVAGYVGWGITLLICMAFRGYLPK